MRIKPSIAVFSVLTVLPIPATSARAQPLTGHVRWEASKDGGFTWDSFITLLPDQPYKVRAMASWTDGPTPSQGLANVAFDQVDLIGALPSDQFFIDTAFKQQPFPGEVWTVQPGSGASSGWKKLDHETPVLPMDMGQLPPIFMGQPNPDFSAANPIRLLEMDAMAGWPLDRNITISGQYRRSGTPPVNSFRVYTTPSGVNKTPAREATQDELRIYIIPAPSTMIALACGGLIVGQRRRA